MHHALLRGKQQWKWALKVNANSPALGATLSSVMLWYNDSFCLFPTAVNQADSQGSQTHLLSLIPAFQAILSHTAAWSLAEDWEQITAAVNVAIKSHVTQACFVHRVAACLLKWGPIICKVHSKLHFSPLSLCFTASTLPCLLQDQLPTKSCLLHCSHFWPSSMDSQSDCPTPVCHKILVLPRSPACTEFCFNEYTFTCCRLNGISELKTTEVQSQPLPL